ncbi:antibiotic biosynthesis monooxygenase [Acidisoma cellulosilytica]|uniref:Antibiotic biosynthesis monooxygenase n=1 Tax=Acidisoma cellulosilyticum TaxID=2802395 RepID=A0A963YXW1_9PROT|nr:putative quinol monooxygenase [Acidisoma cellulosilyticum]MCB8879247.1 antibiotic biosynthesis monooxygenase [Acidisoma cellulosilyticum]
MIHVVAILTAKIGHRAALLAALNAVIDDVRAEPGCIEYQPVIDLAHSSVKFGADTLVVIEKWQDQAALDAHNQGDALKTFLEAAKHVLAQADVHLMQAPG